MGGADGLSCGYKLLTGTVGTTTIGGGNPVFEGRGGAWYDCADIACALGVACIEGIVLATAAWLEGDVFGRVAAVVCVVGVELAVADWLVGTDLGLYLKFGT